MEIEEDMKNDFYFCLKMSFPPSKIFDPKSKVFFN